jgi:hypothetical protein
MFINDFKTTSNMTINDNKYANNVLITVYFKAMFFYICYHYLYNYNSLYYMYYIMYYIFNIYITYVYI